MATGRLSVLHAANGGPSAVPNWRNARRKMPSDAPNVKHGAPHWQPSGWSRPGWPILDITDNCTRQCIELPLFDLSAHVTAEMIVAALRPLLPPPLQFLISDRGVHFTAKVLQKLAAEADFIHMMVARHRPQSNGIAERLVCTLKEWLRDKTWHSIEELTALLRQFREEYNDRPHQGLPLPGLSPDEYAHRLWLS